MSRSEGHFGIDGDCVLRPFQSFVEGCLHGQLVIYNYRCEIAFPDGVPVDRRNQCGCPFQFKSHSFQSAYDNLQVLGIVEFLLNITF